MVAWSPYRTGCLRNRPKFKAARKRLWVQQKGKCFFCGKQCRMPVSGTHAAKENTFTVDHVVPRSRTGHDAAGNLIGSCHGCNAQRDAVEKVLFTCGRALTDERIAHPELFPVVREDELPYLMRMLEKEPT